MLRTVLTEHELVLGEVIPEEFRRVLMGRIKLPDVRWRAVKAVFAAVEIVPKPDAPGDLEVRDPTDQWVLATAVAGRADVLVTGDDDRLAVAARAPIAILTPRAFWEVLRSGGGRRSSSVTSAPSAPPLLSRRRPP